jgi:hypothetical protein
MASGTVRRKGLVRVMNRTIVASLAGTVARLRAEKAGFFHMAGAAAFGQHSMARRHFPAAVNSVVASNRKPPKPNQRQYRHANRQNKSQSPERMRVFEVIQVDALRKLLCRQLSSPHNPSLATLITQSHKRVYAPEQQQRKRKRYMQHQPSVQPMMQPRLPSQLPLLLADIFQVFHRVMCFRRQ